MKAYFLDDEERDLIASVERGEWVSVENLDQEIKKHQQYARNTLRKDKQDKRHISPCGQNVLQPA